MGDLGAFGAPPPRCPKCNSQWVARIAYGLASSNPAFMEALRRGEIVMGPTTTDRRLRVVKSAWHCRNCAHEWGIPER